MLSLCSPSAMLQSTSIFQRGALTVSSAPDFGLMPRGHSLIAWLWWPAELAFLGSTEIKTIGETTFGQLRPQGTVKID